jgi:hypothetical protein
LDNESLYSHQDAEIESVTKEIRQLDREKVQKLRRSENRWLMTVIGMLITQ